MSNKLLIKMTVISSLCLGGVVAAPALAATATTNMAVSATVVAACTISTTALAFPDYSGVAVDSTATLSVLCSNAAPYTVGLGAGTAVGATTALRALTGSVAGSTLNYGLYQEAAHTTNWGDTIDTDTVAGTGTGETQTLTVYGEIAANQLTSAVGTYSDTIAVTVNY
ncbi:spore coat U domain-containing protein [Brenneria corticis]|uniref:Spore coat protein n=1 Tax=Brenneria corticis TaxID=2173106 RepID=A0A2U1TMV6_9GAMM|nr:spore coat U domain-containing protein [Brenneria sp. CFCC 11842]PWC10753.1 spore coat protein [Brenneria sp. CFCC 11842]